MTDPVYHATVQLLHALWLEQCSVVLQYLRMRKGFWENLCKPLFSEPRSGLCFIPVFVVFFDTAFGFLFHINP